MVYPNMLLAWYFSADGPAAEMQASPDASGALEIDDELLDAFETHLARRGITLRFFAGSWSSLSIPGPPANVLLSSETVYAVESIEMLCNAMRRLSTASEPGTTSVDMARRSTLILVAAKVLYFGVGGGVGAFQEMVEQSGGWTQVVRTQSAGVGRVIVRVGWQDI